jgi:hypothetical protein
MQPGTYSPDGRWVWDGQAWRPAPPAGMPPPGGLPPGGVPPGGAPPSAGPGTRPGMFWFFRVPGWFQPYVLMGLIGLIPVVGSMVQVGWYLEARDTMRRGLWQIPPASFEYLRRGLAPWVGLAVFAVYSLVLPVLIGVALWVSVANGAPSAITAFLIVLIWVVLLAAWILVGFLAAAVIGVADHAGMGPACSPTRVWRLATRSPGPSWRVFGAFLLVAVVSGVVGLVMSLLLPVLGGIAATVFLGPAAYLAAAPGQADFDER